MRTCPVTGDSCFDPYCSDRCTGYDISVEATTVITTRITSRGAEGAIARLVAVDAGPREKEPAA